MVSVQYASQSLPQIKAWTILGASITKELSNELAQPICYLFNATLETGQLPEDWKKLK